MVANIICSNSLIATWVKCHLVAINPSGIYHDYPHTGLQRGGALTKKPGTTKSLNVNGRQQGQPWQGSPRRASDNRPNVSMSQQSQALIKRPVTTTKPWAN